MIDLADNFSNSNNLLRKEKRRRIEQDFQTDEILENELWIFLFDIGFTSLNIDRACAVSFGRDKHTLHQKNIDIIAENDDLRVYCECSTQQNIGQKISVWISEVELLRGFDIRNKNTAYVFYTDQELKESESRKLIEKGIKLITPKMLDYFRELTKCYKNLAYFQLLGYLLKDKEIKTFTKEDLTVPAIRGKYSNKDYCYIFGIQPYKLIPLTTVLHRKMSFNEELPTSYQRLVKKKKINEIKEFISKYRGVFPTNIIISFEPKGKFFLPKGPAKNDISFGELSLPRKYNSITVIDGQHRLFAYDKLEMSKTDLIYVIGFEKMDLKEQIRTFVNINEKQTKVSSSLMWDLYTSILHKSEINYRISSIAKRLNQEDKSSALYSVISYDSAPKYSNISSKITLESFCTAINNFEILSKLEALFTLNDIKGDTDSIIFEILKSYFNAIRNMNYEHWDRKEKSKNLLRSNQATGAFIRLLKEILIYLSKKNSLQSLLTNKQFDTLTKEFVKLLNPINNLINDLKTSDQIRAFKRVGEGGKREMFIDFVTAINKAHGDFGLDILDKLSNEYVVEKIARLTDSGEQNDLEAKEAFFCNTKRLNEAGSPFENDDATIQGILKTVVAFANYRGGEIIIGLKDKTWDVVGIDQTDLKLRNNWESYRSSLVNRIMNEIVGLIKAPNLEKYIHQQKTLAIIKVNSIGKKRFEERDLAYLKKDEKVYKRDNDSTIPIKPNEIQKYCNEVLKELEEEELQNEADIEE